MKTERKTGMSRVTNLILGALVVAVVASAAVVDSVEIVVAVAADVVSLAGNGC